MKDLKHFVYMKESKKIVSKPLPTAQSAKKISNHFNAKNKNTSYGSGEYDPKTDTYTNIYYAN